METNVPQQETVTTETVQTETTEVQQTPEATTSTEVPAEEKPVELPPIAPFEIPKQQSVPDEDFSSPEKVLEKFKGDKQALYKHVAKEIGLSDYAMNVAPYLKDEQSMASYWEAMRTDWSKVTAEDLLAMKLKEEYSQVTTIPADRIQRIIQNTLRDTYGFGVDDDTESDEVIMAKIKAHREAESFRQQKIAQQQEVLQTLAKAQPPVQEQPVQVDLVQVMEAQRQALLQDEKVQGFVKSKTLQFGDFNYEVGDPNAALANLCDQNRYLYNVALKNEQGQVMVKDGQPVLDNVKLLKLSVYAENMEAVEKALVEHGKALGKKQLIDERENVQSNQSFGTEAKSETVFDVLLRKQK